MRRSRSALRLAVIGSAGSGKDVLGQMLARLVLPTGGSVRLDGKDFFQVPEYLLGARTAYVGQDTYLFPLSVRDNLLFGLKFRPVTPATYDDATRAIREAFWKEWGIDTHLEARGGVAGIQAQPHAPARQVFLLQRKKSKVGDGLGKTTGWIHRTGLKNKNVQMLNSVEYLKIDDAGLHIRIAGGEQQVLPVDTVIVCAGQDPLRELQEGLESAGQRVHLVGGADVAAELDAKRAIDQGTRLAARL